MLYALFNGLRVTKSACLWMLLLKLAKGVANRALLVNVSLLKFCEN